MSLIERNKPSLSRALGRVNIIGVAVALVISSVVLLVYEAVSLRGALADNARLQAAMVAENMSAPLIFRDSEVASEVLAHLGKLPYIESVAVFDAKGGRFARFVQRGLSEFEQNEGTEAAAQTQVRLSF
jgi:hypothetical protein